MNHTKYLSFPSVGRLHPYAQLFGRRVSRRGLVAVLLLCAAIWPGELGDITREQVVAAFIQVSVFVAATLLLFYGTERLFNVCLGDILRNARRLEVPIAAVLGAIPGCGGAVVVVAAYTSGNASFGAVTATLTATMGDAAFLLIAVRPEAAAVVLPLSVVVGILSGWVIDATFGHSLSVRKGKAAVSPPMIGAVRWYHKAYLVLAMIGLVFGVMQLAMINLPSKLQFLVSVLALLGAFTGLAIWVISPVRAMTNMRDRPTTRMAEETSFISVWVIGAYLAYEYFAAFTGLDLADAFSTVGPVLPIIAILVGFIPGCGPQVLVTTLYLNGLIPFAALIGNAISNDGDALFPAIALEPRSAVLATLCSSVPALLVAYWFYLFAPGFMN